MAAKDYTESSVLTVDPLTHIRMRPGMYIGRLGDGSHHDDGIYVLFKEIIDNSIDEFIMGHGKIIDVDIDFDLAKVKIRDRGRGIPLGKVIDCVSEINTGAKYNDDVFQFSVGLNGIGAKATNALSHHFLVRSVREKCYLEAAFSRGKLIEKKKGKTKEPNGTYVEFIPDPEMFKKYKFFDDYLRKRIWYYAYLNSGLKIKYNGEVIVSEQGLLDLINSEVKDERLYEPFHYAGKGLEFAFLHTQSYGETYFSFVNGQHTSDGGTHLSAFREGLLKGVNEYAKKSFQGVDVREGVVATVLVKVKEPLFESQTKNKMGNPEMRSEWVQQIKIAVCDLLYKHPDYANRLISRIAFNEKVRRELSAVRKEARERQKKIAIKIPKLRDSKYHFNDRSQHGDASMIFITEGDSASASIVASRDPLTQAVFSLRGKPLNVFGLKMDQLYKNEEMFNLMNALNIEDGIDELRYNKVILATDADVDGMHIRNLMITFFLTYFEALVIQGHLYILETPLFKVRNKQQTLYCYSEEKRDRAMRKLKGKDLEVTRFKGLGEISPNEFKQFIAKDIRLTPVSVAAFSDIHPTLQFYMGKNTPERRRFVMKNLENEELVLRELARLAEK
ncbi:type IIA DNA topoisomerase subunit B [Simkania negevensis]|uniref:DNA topoisomerase (ATP-hydrolyzing) n=1 Tax=Simkania negevensis TaxID=83561 RepID=A0ABS3AS32_9BACT|nr:type IIA DNA topoisomerase subunit B [Simkania negevensis]